MEFKSLKLGDILVINSTWYKITYIFAVPTRYTIELTHFSQYNPIKFSLSGKDYDRLIETRELHYLGNIEENEILMLLYG